MKGPFNFYGVKTLEIEKNCGLSSELGISTSLGLCWVEFCSVLLTGIGLDWFSGMFVKRKMFGFQRSCCQKFLKTLVLLLALG